MGAKVLEAFADLVFEQCQQLLVKEFGIDLADAELWARSRAALDRVPNAESRRGDGA